MKTKFLCDKKSQNTPICPVSYYCHCISGLSQVPLKLNCIYSILFFFFFFFEKRNVTFFRIFVFVCVGEINWWWSRRNCILLWYWHQRNAIICDLKRRKNVLIVLQHFIPFFCYMDFFFQNWKLWKPLTRPYTRHVCTLI